MTYQDTSDIYHDTAWRNRAEMCIRDEAFNFVNDDAAHIVALSNAIIASNWVDIESVMAGISTQDIEATVIDDQVMKDTVVGVWPVVAAARYPHMIEQPADVVFRSHVAVPVSPRTFVQSPTDLP